MTKSIALEIGLSDEIVSALCAIFYPISEIDEVVVFGSRAKGNFRSGSDIDLAIKGAQVNFGVILHLNGRIDDLELLYKIDLQSYARISNSELKEHIDRVGKVIWKRR